MTPASPYRSPHTSLRQNCRLRWVVAPRTTPVSLWPRGTTPKPQSVPQAACGSHSEPVRPVLTKPTCSPAPHAVGAHGCMSFDGRGRLFFFGRTFGSHRWSLSQRRKCDAPQGAVLDCAIGWQRSRAFRTSTAHAAYAELKCGSIQAPPAAPATST